MEVCQTTQLHSVSIGFEKMVDKWRSLQIQASKKKNTPDHTHLGGHVDQMSLVGLFI